ncbi:MAG: transglutaminase-like cysteine peptidase [Burkholderiales bacterium]
MSMVAHAGPGRCIGAWVLCWCVLCHQAAAADFVAPPALALVNQALNHHVAFAPDAINWGRADYWATSDELQARRAGDCEDYAIAKYFALLAEGVPAQQLRLVYARVLLGGTGDLWQPHMVLAYLPSIDSAGDELILDNMLDEIRPLSQRPDLQVVISFDTHGVWRALQRGPPAREARQIVRWAQVLQRMLPAH